MFTLHSSNFLPHALYPLPHHPLISTFPNFNVNTNTSTILCCSSSHHHHDSTTTTSRRSLLVVSTALSLSPPRPPPSSAAPDSTPPPIDTTITDRVFLDFSLCSTYFRAQTQPQDSPLCSDSVPMGRIVLGLYGKLLPITVSNFKAMCNGSSGSSYKNTLVHKILSGQFLVAGKQGKREKGEVIRPVNLTRNTETVESRAFMLQHSRPGVLSLCLSENDDEDDIKLDPEYHNVEFLITTGPGPCPQLDGRNIVFGTVLEGMDVVRAIAAAPTYKPAERIRQLNDLAGLLGDERAQNARALWNRPLKSIYVSDCGLLQVAKPSLSPSLP